MRRILSIGAGALLLAVSVPGLGFAADARTLADGQSWQMTGQNGRSGRMTLNADGSGAMRMGPFSMGLTWWAQQTGGLCIESARMGTRCVELVQIGSGYDGMADGQVVMQLRR